MSNQDSSSDNSIEAEIVAKGLKAPRITPADVEMTIAGEYFFTAENGVLGALDAPLQLEGTTLHSSLRLLTICVLVLRNGFTVIGESACASPDNFNAALGGKIARTKAVEKIWPLLGFQLRSALSIAERELNSDGIYK